MLATQARGLFRQACRCVCVCRLEYTVDLWRAAWKRPWIGWVLIQYPNSLFDLWAFPREIGRRMLQFISQFELFSRYPCHLPESKLDGDTISWEPRLTMYYQQIKITQQQTTSRTYLATVIKVGFGTVFSNVAMETMRLSIISEELTWWGISDDIPEKWS